jgi:hypothetical protein
VRCESVLSRQNLGIGVTITGCGLYHILDNRHEWRVRSKSSIGMLLLATRQPVRIHNNDTSTLDSFLLSRCRSCTGSGLSHSYPLVSISSSNSGNRASDLDGSGLGTSTAENEANNSSSIFRVIESCSIALLFKMRLDNYRFDFMSISMVQPE